MDSVRLSNSRFRWHLLLLILALTLTPAPVMGEALSAEKILAAQPPSLVRQLHKKKVVLLQNIRSKETGNDSLIVGFVIFEGKRERVYRLLTQTTRQIEFRPEITSIETVSQSAEGPVDRHQIEIVFKRFVYHLRWHLDPQQRKVWWELDDTRENALDRVYGSWELYDLGDDRTLGRFTASVDVGDAVPDFLQDYITRRNLPTTMERNRRWVDSGGTYRP